MNTHNTELMIKVFRFFLEDRSLDTAISEAKEHIKSYSSFLVENSYQVDLDELNNLEDQLRIKEFDLVKSALVTLKVNLLELRESLINNASPSLASFINEIYEREQEREEDDDK